MIDARHYRVVETLRNGVEICIRAARAEDLAGVLEAFRQLEAQSVYLRFFGPKKELSEADIRQFVNTDFDNQVRLLCTLFRDGHEVVIAAASYVRAGDAAAEVAFVVEEDYHGLGIARRMMHHLGVIARGAGIKQLVAEVLPQNNAMLAVFRGCGWPVSLHTEDGTVHVSMALGAG